MSSSAVESLSAMVQSSSGIYHSVHNACFIRINRFQLEQRMGLILTSYRFVLGSPEALDGG